jgi:hypothetical protein
VKPSGESKARERVSLREMRKGSECGCGRAQKGAGVCGHDATFSLGFSIQIQTKFQIQIKHVQSIQRVFWAQHDATIHDYISFDKKSLTN